jgi:hypothetical protein
MAKGFTTAYSAGKVNQLRVEVRADLSKDIDPAVCYVVGNMACLTREAIEKVLLDEYRKSLEDMDLKDILNRFVAENGSHQVMCEQ